MSICATSVCVCAYTCAREHVVRVCISGAQQLVSARPTSAAQSGAHFASVNALHIGLLRTLGASQHVHYAPHVCNHLDATMPCRFSWEVSHL
eukprot:5401448-Alexandrium_andersonii.AAC.1